MEGGTKGEREGEGEGEGGGGREGDREEERKDERKDKTDTGKEEEQWKEWYISETTCNNIDDNKLDITHTHTHTSNYSTQQYSGLNEYTSPNP